MTLDEFINEQIEKDPEGLLDMLLTMALQEGDKYSAEDTEKDFMDAAENAFEVIKFINALNNQQPQLEEDTEGLEDLILQSNSNVKLLH
jgi:hypothetical protein